MKIEIPYAYSVTTSQGLEADYIFYNISAAYAYLPIKCTLSQPAEKTFYMKVKFRFNYIDDFLKAGSWEDETSIRFRKGELESSGAVIPVNAHNNSIEPKSFHISLEAIEYEDYDVDFEFHPLFNELPLDVKKEIIRKGQTSL